MVQRRIAGELTPVAGETVARGMMKQLICKFSVYIIITRK